MLWFRLAAVLFITITLIWAIGVAGGTIEMFSYGSTTRGMTDDPTKNGTITIYVALTANEIIIIIAAFFGLIIAFRMWRNNYQIDHQLRHLFLVWLAMWVGGLLLCLTLSIYMIVKGKDNQENMAILFDTFQKYSQDTKFVSTLEKYQRESQCCGIYGPDDWLMLQLRQMPMAGGGGGGYQSLDYGFRQNPSTGKCHMVPPTIPPGCGLKIMEDVNFRLKIYAACCMAEIVLGAVSAALSWYCFFYWLEKEVIVIPEDEVSNLIIIEPESDTTVELNPDDRYLPSGAYFSSSQRRSSYGRTESRNSFGRGRESQYKSRAFSRSRSPFEGSEGFSRLHQGSRYLHNGGRSRPQVIHLTQDEILKEQEEALGGKVLAEMHIEHKSTKMLAASGSQAGKHHATIALVRNKHPPKPKEVLGAKGHHGQTGHLAQDIADMSGGGARGYIEDVVIPMEPPGVRPHAVQVPIDAHIHSRHNEGNKSREKDLRKHSMGGVEAQNLIEGVIAPPEDHHHAPSVVIGRNDHQSHHQNHHSGHHELTHPRYLPPLGHHNDGSRHHDHGSRQDHHNRYLEDGSPHGHHHNEHHHGGYPEARYLQDGGPYHGGHENRYLHDGGHHRDHFGGRTSHYNDSRTDHHGHEHQGHHENHHEHHENHHENHHEHHENHHLPHHENHHRPSGFRSPERHREHHRRTDSRDVMRKATTTIFKNTRPLDDSD